MMKKVYISPHSIVYDIETSDIVCNSYGTIPVGGRTDSFDDTHSGTISTGGTTNGFDAAQRRTSSWDEYEN